MWINVIDAEGGTLGTELVPIKHRIQFDKTIYGHENLRGCFPVSDAGNYMFQHLLIQLVQVPEGAIGRFSWKRE